MRSAGDVIRLLYSGAIRSLLAVIAVVLAAIAGTAGPARAAGATPGRVTVIADSVMTAVLWNAKPLSILEHGFSDVDMQVGICRTLTGESCPFDGERVPDLIDLVQSLGSQIGQTVVVEVGYNDSPATFASSFKQSIQALLAAGVKHIFWVNYHVWQPEFATLDDTVAKLARKVPQVTVVDWQTVSAVQYHWFQGDGIHLLLPGAMALATLVNTTLTETLTPVTPPTLPVEHVTVGKSFSLSLAPEGGIAPYQWQVTRAALPRGLHLLADGLLEGVPARPGKAVIHLLVTDADGKNAPMTLRLDASPESRNA